MYNNKTELLLIPEENFYFLRASTSNLKILYLGVIPKVPKCRTNFIDHQTTREPDL